MQSQAHQAGPVLETSALHLQPLRKTSALRASGGGSGHGSHPDNGAASVRSSLSRLPIVRVQCNARSMPSRPCCATQHQALSWPNLTSCQERTSKGPEPTNFEFRPISHFDFNFPAVLVSSRSMLCCAAHASRRVHLKIPPARPLTHAAQLLRQNARPWPNRQLLCSAGLSFVRATLRLLSVTASTTRLFDLPLPFL